MFQKCILCGIIILSLTIISCGPKPQTTQDESKRCNPHSLTIASTASHYVKVAWNPGCPGTRIMRGFNVYYSPTPLVGRYPGHDLPKTIKPYNKEPYPGDSEGDMSLETFEFKNIPSAQLFYVHVRVVNSDNSLSLPSNEIEMICYPQGEIGLVESYSGDHSGFSFVTDSYCATDAVENDMYFFGKDGKDYLCSPSRVSSINRANKIYILGPAESIGAIDPVTPKGVGLEKADLIPGTVYVIETPDGRFAKLRLIKMDEVDGKRVARFDYYYLAPVIKQEKGA